MWEIYLAVSPSGTPYIGQTKVGIFKRLAKHSKDAASGSDLPFHRAITKYGLDAFSISTAATCFTKADADVFERALIAVYRKQGPTYNIADGGQGGGDLEHAPGPAEVEPVEMGDLAVAAVTDAGGGEEAGGFARGGPGQEAGEPGAEVRGRQDPAQAFSLHQGRREEVLA